MYILWKQSSIPWCFFDVIINLLDIYIYIYLWTYYIQLFTSTSCENKLSHLLVGKNVSKYRSKWHCDHYQCQALPHLQAALCKVLGPECVVDCWLLYMQLRLNSFINISSTMLYQIVIELTPDSQHGWFWGFVPTKYPIFSVGLAGLGISYIYVTCVKTPRFRPWDNL